MITTLSVQGFDEEIGLNQIVFIRDKGDDKSLIGFYQKKNGRNTLKKGLVNVQFYDLLEMIKNEDLEFYGRRKIDTEESAMIRLLRVADGTVYAYLCSECGNVDKIYHTNKCGCQRYKRFDGEFKKGTNKLTKQVVYLTGDNKNEKELGLKYDKYGTHESFKTIEIKKVSNNLVKGFLKMKGVTVELTPQLHDHTQCTMKNIMDNPQHWVWC
mgnify:CR=1 FL=1|tara:strand:- start:2806 stop:3441 length:636 start_codon:yes stop_codon:yes gene_type:complete